METKKLAHLPMGEGSQRGWNGDAETGPSLGAGPLGRRGAMAGGRRIQPVVDNEGRQKNGIFLFVKQGDEHRANISIELK